MNKKAISSKLKLSRNQTFIIVIITLYLWSPIVAPVHVEGFSASIQSIAMHLVNDNPLDYDRIFPFNFEFFFSSRFGMNFFVAEVMRVLPIKDDLAMSITMWLGFLMLIPASAMLICRWANTDWAAALGFIVLMPGIAQSAFFYNDNVLSAGLAIAAIAICTVARHGAMLVAAGAMLGSAMLVRPDCVLILPAIGLIIWRNVGLRAIAIKHFLLLSLGLLGIMLISRGTYGIDFFQTMKAANYAIALWNRWPSIETHTSNLLLFMGIPGAIFFVLGISQALRSKDWFLILLLVGVPMAYNLIYWGKLWQARQLLPLTPFLGALAAHGVRTFSEIKLALRVAIITVFIAITIAPPLHLTTHLDGPHSNLGFLWSPLLWREWQNDVHKDFEHINHFVDKINSNTIIITDTWNIDRYIHLALQKAEFTILNKSAREDRCGRSSETFYKNGFTVTHIRLITPFLKDNKRLVPVRFDAYVTPCFQQNENSSLIFYANLLQAISPMESADQPSHESEQNFAVLKMWREEIQRLRNLPGVWRLALPRYHPHAIIQLDTKRLAALRKSYIAEEARFTNGLLEPDNSKFRLSESEQLLQPRLGLAEWIKEHRGPWW